MLQRLFSSDSVDFENQFARSRIVVLNPGCTLEPSGKDRVCGGGGGGGLFFVFNMMTATPRSSD